MRNQVWNNFCNQKFKACYLHEFNSILRNIDLALGFLMALATTASVASWAFWKEWPWLWVAIVGASQFVVVAKPFFPYLRELRRFTELELLHDRFAFEFEKLWIKLEKGTTVDTDLLKKREELVKALERFHDLNALDTEGLRIAARKKRNDYLQIQYGVKI